MKPRDPISGLTYERMWRWTTEDQSRSTPGIVIIGARRLLNGASRSIGSIPRKYRSVTSRRA